MLCKALKPAKTGYFPHFGTEWDGTFSVAEFSISAQAIFSSGRHCFAPFSEDSATVTISLAAAWRDTYEFVKSETSDWKSTYSMFKALGSSEGKLLLDSVLWPRFIVGSCLLYTWSKLLFYLLQLNWNVLNNSLAIRGCAEMYQVTKFGALAKLGALTRWPFYL